MPRFRFLAPLLLWCATLYAEPLDEIGRPVDDSVIPGSEIRFKVALAGAKDNVKTARLKDGSLVYIVKRLGSGTDRMLTPNEFCAVPLRSADRARMALHSIQCDESSGLGLGCYWLVRSTALRGPHDYSVVHKREKQTFGRACLVLVDESHRSDDAARLFHLASRYRRNPRPGSRVDHLCPESRVDQAPERKAEVRRKN